MAGRLGDVLRARLALVLALVCSSCISLEQFAGDSGLGGCPSGDCNYPLTKVCHKPTMHALAKDLDHLEKHIDWYGSVVAKVPDVWGQARLTKHREEFEDRMAVELDTFGVKLNGNLARTDQSFFAQAVALGAAASRRRTTTSSQDLTRTTENKVTNTVENTSKTDTATEKPKTTGSSSQTGKVEGTSDTKGTSTDSTKVESLEPPKPPDAASLITT